MLELGRTISAETYGSQGPPPQHSRWHRRPMILSFDAFIVSVLFPSADRPAARWKRFAGGAPPNRWLVKGINLRVQPAAQGFSRKLKATLELTELQPSLLRRGEFFYDLGQFIV